MNGGADPMLEAERSQETAGGGAREPVPFPPGWAELFGSERAPGARIVVVPDDGARTPLDLSSLLEEAAGEPEASTLAAPVAQALGRLAEGALESLGGAARLSDLLARAAEGLTSALDASEAALTQATPEAKRVLERLPAADAVLLDGQGPFRDASRLLRRERKAARHFVLQVRNTDGGFYLVDSYGGVKRPLDYYPFVSYRPFARRQPARVQA